MDLVKLIRGVRNIKIYNKLNGFRDKIKFAIKNS